MSASTKKPIRPSDQLNIQSWQLPDLDGPTVNEVDALGNLQDRRARMQKPRPAPAHPEPMTEEDDPESEFTPPTAAELQALREAAREEGFADGQKAGYEAGYASGHEEGLKAGHTEGEQRGLAEGQEKAQAAAEAALDAEKRALAQQLGTAIARMNQREQALEDELAPVARDLILRLTQGLVVQSLQQAPEQIEHIVHQAVQLMPSAHERMDVFLHPDDFSLLRGLDLHWMQNIALHADDTLSPGGCTVKTRHSLLDYSLDRRFQVQIQALLDNEWSPPDERLRTFTHERFQSLLELSAEATTACAESAAVPEPGPEPRPECDRELENTDQDSPVDMAPTDPDEPKSEPGGVTASVNQDDEAKPADGDEDNHARPE